MIDRAIQCLSNKSYSEIELRELLEFEFREELNLHENVNEVMRYLRVHRLLNDSRLAQELTRHYAHKGNNFIRHLLEQRKIKKALIEEMLAQLPKETIRAWEETQKKLFSLGKVAKSEQITIIRRFLMGRQFSLAAINQIIDRLTCVKAYQLKDLKFNTIKKYTQKVA